MLFYLAKGGNSTENGAEKFKIYEVVYTLI